MPVTKSAKKALRQNRRKRVFNLRTNRQMKDLVKNIKGLISQNKKEEAKKTIPQAYKTLDKAAKKGIIKKNTASRKKARLTRAINRLQ